MGDAYIAVAGIYTESDASSRLPPGSPQDVSPTSNEARENLERVFQLAQLMHHELAVMRERMGLPLRLRIGLHSGAVAAGIIGMQRQRFCASACLAINSLLHGLHWLLGLSFAGVLGPAITEAEHAQEAGLVDHITCTDAVRRVFGVTDHPNWQFNDLVGARSTTEASSQRSPMHEFFDVTGIDPLPCSDSASCQSELCTADAAHSPPIIPSAISHHL